MAMDAAVPITRVGAIWHTTQGSSNLIPADHPHQPADGARLRLRRAAPAIRGISLMDFQSQATSPPGAHPLMRTWLVPRASGYAA